MPQIRFPFAEVLYQKTELIIFFKYSQSDSQAKLQIKISPTDFIKLIQN